MTAADASQDPRTDLADASRQFDQARQRVGGIEQAQRDAWDDALDEIDNQLRHLAITAFAGITEASRYNKLITLADQVSIHLLRTWHDRMHGLRITTSRGLEAEFSGYGTPPPATAVLALVRALLEQAGSHD